MDYYQLIEPLGIATGISLLLTAALALFHKKNPAALRRWHKRAAIVTILLALSHFTMIMLSRYLP